jgi:hypothetical protein
MDPIDQLEIWTFYNVLLPGVLPIGLVWSGLHLVQRPRAILDIIGDGQLCFFAIATVAVTINDIGHMATEKKATPFATRYLQWAEPSSYPVVICTVFVFGLIVYENSGNAATDRRRLTWTSALLTAFALCVVYFWRYNLGLFT